MMPLLHYKPKPGESLESILAEIILQSKVTGGAVIQSSFKGEVVRICIPNDESVDSRLLPNFKNTRKRDAWFSRAVLATLGYIGSTYRGVNLT